MCWSVSGGALRFGGLVGVECGAPVLAAAAGAEGAGGTAARLVAERVTLGDMKI